LRWQENCSFANIGRDSVCVVCKSAVLCVGCLSTYIGVRGALSQLTTGGAVYSIGN